MWSNSRFTLPLALNADCRRSSSQRAASGGAAAAELATYQPLRSLNRPTMPSWFQGAVHEVVRQLEDSPFLQLVRLGEVGGASQPQFSSYSVPHGVVAAPELWRAVAETLSSDSPDVVILVDKVEPQAAAGASPPAEQGPNPAEPRTLSSEEMKAHVEDACRALVGSGVARSMLTGQVGDCCEGEDHAAPRAAPQSQAQQPRGGIVPFRTAGGLPRSTVRVTAIPPPGSHGALSGYWGVVVQSRRHTGAEGCYLLKAVRPAPAYPGGCSCTHYSLTRVCEGENLERQFVQSWLV